MNRTYLILGLWVLSLVAAFVIGSQLGGSSTGEADPGDASRGLLYGDGRLSALPGETGLAVENEGAELMSGGDAELADLLVELTGARIAELGALALKSANPLERRAAFDELLKGLTAENALEIREQILGLRHDSSEWRDFHYAWGAIAGDEAVLHGMESEERDMAVTLAGWAGADSASALAWYNGLSDEQRAENYTMKAGLVHGLADADPAAAAQFVFDLNEKGDKQAEGLLSIVTGEMLRTVGAEEASRWSESLPDGPLRAAAMDRVANRYVAEDPVAAAAWAEQFAGEPESARVIEEVGDEWAERDPEAAISWLESLDTGAGKVQGLQSAFGEWVKRDPRSASEYLLAMNDSPERDSAIGGFVRRLAYEDPQSALAWAEEISDPGARERTLVRAGQAMIYRNVKGTKEWLKTSGLSDEAKKQVLNPPRRDRRR